MKLYKPFTLGPIRDGKMTTRGENVLHGDVIIIRCDEADMPTDFDSLPAAKNEVLAEGEHSGHAHALFDETDESTVYIPPARKLTAIEGGLGKVPTGQFSVKVTPTGEMYMKVTGAPMCLRHQEHAPIRIYPGNYQIGIQQEIWDDVQRALVD